MKCPYCKAEMNLETMCAKGWEYFACPNNACPFLQRTGRFFMIEQNKRLTDF